MINSNNIIQLDYTQIIARFVELTGEDRWAIINKIELAEQTCQHEQDWMYIYYPDNHDYVTEDVESVTRNGTMSLEAVLRWLVIKGELNGNEFLVTS